MINFRYHVVSLTAVFLSLAVGLVLGSTVLNGPMLDALNSQVTTLGQANQQLREQVNFLEGEAEREEAFAAEAAALLLHQALPNRRVTVVVLPEATDYAEELVEMLELAGAQVTGTVRLTDRFAQPAHRLNQLLDLAHESLPPSVDADALPANSDGVETSAALLARVLLDLPGSGDEPVKPGAEPAASPSGVPDEDRNTVLSAYRNEDYLEFDEPPTGPAEIIVVVAALPFTDTDAAEKNEAMLTTVEQFSLVGPVVVAAAGPSGRGNVVAEIRDDPELVETISTVDNVSTPQGQVATGLAVARHLTGEVGHYGDGDGAQSLLPALR
ncbi:MAG TPA: copper transporter [Natronosporangium sp.]|nr:copper transporter [Natronosporangium sp.]